MGTTIRMSTAAPRSRACGPLPPDRPPRDDPRGVDRDLIRHADLAATQQRAVPREPRRPRDAALHRQPLERLGRRQVLEAQPAAQLTLARRPILAPHLLGR
eukprot:2325876-Prymnesium_polylepis.1